MLFNFRNLNLLPQTPGIYQFLSEKKEILYIGKAINLKKRVSSYLSTSLELKTSRLVQRIKFIKIIPVIYEFEALLLEAKLINLYKPKYNVIWKDDKHYIYLKITNEEFPRVLLSRRADTEENLFGPFPSTSALRNILRHIRKIFPFCTQKANSKRACFYTHIGLCNPCPAEVKKISGKKYLRLCKIYFKNIKQIKNLFLGNIQKVRQSLLYQMQQYSAEEKFEQATIYREKLKSLDYLLKQYHSVEAYIENPLLTVQVFRDEEKELSKILSNYFPQLNLLKRIECYDISNISGKLAVGSLVTFINGQPEKKFYRRFRIKTVNQPNDFAMLKDLLKRRLKHPEWGMPDLLVVDGGTPQCRTFKEVLTGLDIKIPFIGIAKEDEAFVIPTNTGFDRTILPRNSTALHLVQRVRDEAHRFAHNYHTLLRLKTLLAGEKRKRML